MYMNKTKRNLILAAAIINLIGIAANLILTILLLVYKSAIEKYLEYMVLINVSGNLVWEILTFVAGLVGSILLLYSVREKGKYYRNSQGIFIAGFIIVCICGSFVSWILLFISLFVSDVIIINSKSDIRNEMREEQKQQERQEQIYEDKKKQIEDLKRLREAGMISEEEYKQKLFEIL